MNELHAYVSPQGNVFSRKVSDPSGYMVSTPKAFPKTFRNLDAAVLFAVKQGCKVHLTLPLKKTGQAALLQAKFNESLVRADLALSAVAVEQEE